MTTSSGRRKPRGCVLRALGFYGLFLICVLLAWLVGGSLVGSRQLRQELRAWEAAGMSMEAFRERFPRTGASAEAVELDRLARQCGIRLRYEPTDRGQIDSREVYDVSTRYLRELREATGSRRVAPPPGEVRRLLREQHAAIEAVADHLVASRDISWELNVDAGLEPPVPSLLAHRYLHELLLLEALERERRGDHEAAGRFLRAGRRQRASLSSRPDLLSQLIASALAQDAWAVLRMIPAAAPDSPRELTRSSFLPDRVRALQSEALGWLTWAREPRGIADLDGPLEGGAFRGSPPSWPVRFMTMPYMRISAASMSSHIRHGCALMRTADPCAVALVDVQQAIENEIARWDAISKAAMPSLGRAWASALETDLEGERTRLVLEAYQHRRRHGSWGTTTSVASEVCPSLVWLRKREADGRLTILPEPLPLQDLESPRGWAFTLAIR